MKKGTKIFLVSLVIEIVVETISDTRKEYLDHIDQLEDAYKKLKKLKREEIGGDVYAAAVIEYELAHEKVVGDSFLWGKLVPKNKRALVDDMDAWVMANNK
jgi:hypothetical protein